MKPGPILAALFATTAVLAGSSGTDAYRALGVPTKDVLSGTVLQARVVPGEAKQVVCVVTYLTGKNNEADAVNVRLGVFDRFGDGLVSLYTRDFGEDLGGYVANGDLQLVDLDLDRVNEIIVSFDSFADPLIKQRFGEVLVRRDDGYRTAWSGLLRYDATRAARTVPRERQDYYIREIDLSATMRTRGGAIVMKKKVIAVAGERLSDSRVVEESFPFHRPDDTRP